jgi:ribonuclease VapC
VIIDTSAVIAILRNEPEAPAFTEAIATANRRRISAANYLEAAIVMDGNRDPVVSRRFDEFVEAAELAIEPVTMQQMAIARAAYRDFGRGSGHPASLDFGDCFAYALAKDTGESLLFKGDDFGCTDLKPALA